MIVNEANWNFYLRNERSERMKVKAKLFENKKIVYEGEGIEALKKIDDLLKK